MRLAHIAGLAFFACGLVAAEAPKGSIEGQIINLATGTPLKKANVRLVAVRQRTTANGQAVAGVVGGMGSGGGMIGPMPLGGPMPSISTVETDDQGRFAFPGLEPGRYTLSAERAGFLRQNYGAKKYSGGGSPITLGQDQRVANIVFKLSPQSVIVGKVLDEDGEPVANAQVQAHRYMYVGGKKRWQRVGGGQTSDIGEYRIPNLEPGRYLVSADARALSRNIMQPPSTEPLPNAPDMIYGNTYFPSTLDSSGAQPIDVGPGGEVRGIDIKLRKTAVYRVRGKVALSGEAENGRRGMTMVQLWPKDGPGFMGAPLMSAVRPPDNRFEIHGVAPGSYILHTQFRGGDSQAIAYQEVQVGNGHVDGLVLTPAAGRDVAGIVKVEDATAPVAVSNVSLFVRTNFPMGGSARGKVGEDAKFTLKNVQPLPATVSVSGVPDNCYVKSIRYGGQEIPEGGVDLSTGGTVEVILSATAGEVDAVALDKEGKPSAGAIVTLIPKAGGDTNTRGADENGSVAFKGLKPGEYKLVAWEDIPPGAAQDPDFVKKFDSRGETAKLEPSGRQAVQLKVVPVSETEQ